MCPAIQVDNEVYRWLQSQAPPFVDTPNSVLRRIAGFDRAPQQEIPTMVTSDGQTETFDPGRRPPLAKGNELLSRRKIPARQARFHRDGTFFQRPTGFPVALNDLNGYALFETEDDLRHTPGVRVTLAKVHVLQQQGGISCLPNYKEVEDHL